MKLIEILQGLEDGRFHKGEEIKSDEGFWFKITDDDLLLGEADGEVFEIGKLLITPLPASSDKP